ncbi:hypothetical protein KY361_00910 [Candidatus Woesearchaeota archaeon]|nr:hypothetical protein [Candidatus Woesearchaeota archaeon]
MMFLLKCPKCGNKMKYDSRGQVLTGKRKRCVYCGFSMSVNKSIIKKL